MSYQDMFGAKRTLKTNQGQISFFDINALESEGIASVSRLPFSIKVLLESLLRNANGYDILAEDVVALARWQPDPGEINVPLKLARVILQDFTGVPAVVDLAAMRSAMTRLQANPSRINPLVPVDLVIDHSVQVDVFGNAAAFINNVSREYERNEERYGLLKWAQGSLDNFRVVPPGMGIVHQVNLEYLGQVIMSQWQNNENFAFPDTLVGTDSHTTMINGLGILGWGVGGIEAEAVMLGQPYYMLAPKVVGVKITGELPEGATATDLVLTITEMLRHHGVVDKFVEFYGSGLEKLSVADRATIANMAPEYGATTGFFPIDIETLSYLRLTGRTSASLDLVERYSNAMGLFRNADTPDPLFSETLELDMSSVEPSLAGPKRPQDRVPLKNVKPSFLTHLTKPTSEQGFALKENELNSQMEIRRQEGKFEITHGSVAIAAITSCTNTSNPSVMIGAGLLAKKAVDTGLSVPPWVKTSLAPGSRVVTNYLERSGLAPYLDVLGFHLVGYGCTTCIGNSGPLPEDVAAAVEEGDLVVASVLSGNRNFEGRINAHTRANYLASPMLVVAYALAGRMDFDFANEPLGHDPSGDPIFLKNIWPSQQEIRQTVGSTIDSEMFNQEYGSIFDGEERWQALPVSKGELYKWEDESTYVQEPPFFQNLKLQPDSAGNIEEARVLAVLGDSVTTDHISPAGNIAADTPAGQYLIANGVIPRDFNSYGARRGNHEVMVRGTFANIRLKNLMLDGVEGGVTLKLPENETTSIYEAAMRYENEKVPLIILAGKEYGAGSSRDWAAKGPYLLGVRAVIAESYERIHRSNLIGMGVLPLQFLAGQTAQSLGLTGREVYSISGLEDTLPPGSELEIIALREDGKEIRFNAIVRINTPIEANYYTNGGILQTVLRQLISESQE